MVYDPAKLIDQVDPDCVVQGVVGPGLTLFVGIPHSYKSYMALDLTYCVATGEDFLGTFRCRRGHVIYVALEDRMPRVMARLDNMELKFPLGGATFLDDRDILIDGTLQVEVVETYIKDKQPALIIVDTLARFSPKLKDSIGSLNKLARDHEIPIIAVDHPLKINSNKKGGITIAEVKGAYSDVAGSADGFLGLSRHGSDKFIRGTFTIDHKDLPPQQLALVMDLDVMRWRISEEDPIASLPQHNQDIITYLQQHPLSSPKEIGIALKVGGSTMRGRLKALADKGKVHPSGTTRDRRYSLYPLLLGPPRTDKRTNEGGKPILLSFCPSEQAKGCSGDVADKAVDQASSATSKEKEPKESNGVTAKQPPKQPPPIRTRTRSRNMKRKPLPWEKPASGSEK